MAKKDKLPKMKKPSWWEEFKTFAVKGNAMALAVGAIIGASFTTITKSLTDNIIMPVVNIFLGGTDFTELKVELPRIVPVYEDVLNEAGEVIDQVYVPHYLTYGNFISAVINFVIIAFVVFLMVKFVAYITELGKKKEAEAAAAVPPAPPAPSNEELLLAEIRDLLKNK